MERQQLEFVKTSLESSRQYFEKYLAESASSRKIGVPDKLFEAMEYSLSSGGKRLRPALCLAAADSCGCRRADALPMALGLEMFHSASLIHDDLPCMDDDDLRRGRPSSHKMFGEAMAVLAGDSLLIEAFAYPLGQTKNVDIRRLQRAALVFSRAAGAAGVCGGQALDMDTARHGDSTCVEETAMLKTATLIRAAALCGAALGTDDENILQSFASYGTHLGMAFQIVDDILDATSTTGKLGKTTGKDAAQGKLTHVTVLGIDTARQLAEAESLAAVKSLADCPQTDGFLKLLPMYLVQRTY